MLLKNFIKRFDFKYMYMYIFMWLDEFYVF